MNTKGNKNKKTKHLTGPIKNIYFISASLFLVALSIFNLSIILYKKSEVLGTSDPVEEEAKFWRNFLESYPTYKNGWLELAKLEFRRGNVGVARYALEQAEKIDPNFEKAVLLKKELGF